MCYKAIIFDLDGVICHTDRFHFAAWKQIAQTLDLYFDEALGDKLRGIGRMESFEIILDYNHKAMSYEDKVRYISQKNTLYRSLLSDMTPKDLDDDVRRTLDTLREAGCKLAIGSSSKNATFILGRLGLGTFFDAVSDGTGITHPKPDPEVFLKAAESLRLPPAACLVVEDAQSGIAAAAAGGMDSAALGDATNSPQATYHLSKLSDILIHVL